MLLRIPVAIVLSLFCCSAWAYEAGPKPAAQGTQFTFAWPLGEGALKPRGATTRGAPIVLDTAPAAAWQRLREPGLSGQERDRRAILAMAGPYRVSFDFLEVVRFDPALKPDAPYQSWGTEYVFVSEDRPDFIALQHILVMRVQMDDGQDRASRSSCGTGGRNGAIEPETLLAYDGANTWARRPLSPEERRGAWVQSVLQVDDSPRYAARGRWEHGDSFSTWLSDETWRPLPRREFSVRKDYQVLVGTNRHTITPTGWVQEENNLKVALDASGKPRAAMPYLAREYGLARYEHIKDYDFARASATSPAPSRSGPRCARRGASSSGATAASPCARRSDQGQLFMPFFEYADKLSGGGACSIAPTRAPSSSARCATATSPVRSGRRAVRSSHERTRVQSPPPAGSRPPALPLKRNLPESDVHPAIELAADLRKVADFPEAALLVERYAAGIGQSNTAYHRVQSPPAQLVQQRHVERVADARTGRAAAHVYGALDRVVVRRARAPARGVRIGNNGPVGLGDQPRKVR